MHRVLVDVNNIAGVGNHWCCCGTTKTRRLARPPRVDKRYRNFCGNRRRRKSRRGGANESASATRQRSARTDAGASRAYRKCVRARVCLGCVCIIIVVRSHDSLPARWMTETRVELRRRPTLVAVQTRDVMTGRAAAMEPHPAS